MTDGFAGHWDGEQWVYFDWAADEIGDKLAVPPGAAQVYLRKLCASGEIRSIVSEIDLYEEPERIPPSRWRAEDVDHVVSWKHFIAVSKRDLDHWLDQQFTRPHAGGKQSRLARLLAEMFPTGVPPRGDYPRERLRAELLARDADLFPLDLKTLKTAIDAYNRQLGNTRNASVSD